MADSFPIFDFILLGLGTDGHTASLFPEDAALGETTRWVRSITGGTPRVHRVTLTLPVINHARHIVFLITGAEKAGSASRVMEARDPSLPAARVMPVRGALSWVLDTAAAKELQQ
jgi:6-phosphogluconolactonase